MTRLPSQAIVRTLTALILATAGLAGCSHKLEGPTPTVEETTLTYCGADSQAFVLRGSGLSPLVVDGATDEPRIDLPDVCLIQIADAMGNPVSGAMEICIPEEDVQWVSQNEIRFTTHASLNLAPGLYDVVVRNPDGKEVRGQATIRVLSEGLLVFWADPSVVYNGISTQVTIYGAGFDAGAIETVAIRDASFTETPVDWMPISMSTTRIQAIIPQGTATGQYDVVVHATGGCQAELIRGVTVVDTVDPTLITNIDPSFGWTNEPTAVTISGAGFGNVPRAYLNPDMPTATTVAASLESVAFVSDTVITGVVPQGLMAGLYDVIVVNPDGRVGLIDNGFTITAAAPPVIDNVSPNYLDNDTEKTVTITGSNFSSPTVTLDCRLPDGTMMMLTATAAAGSASAFDATLPVGGLPDGTVCVVRVTNADGAYFDYSAIGISNPSSNLNDFAVGPAMAEARRAPSVAAGRATRAARFVYAIGGDNGTPAGALATVETTPVDIFGVPNAWFAQPVSLPAPRTLSGVATVGRFLYLVGGNDGAAPSARVSRAQVLDPLASPDIVDVAARRGDGQGIGPGVWYYRVSAVMADTDPSNPGGETLASDPLAINLPSELDGTLVITIFWQPVTGAKAYRIYRSPSPDMPLGSALRLAEVTGGMTTSYEDVSATPMAPGPLPLGATGVWMDMPMLGTAREALGVTAVPDPGNPMQWHLYAIGGRAGAAVATVEHLAITLGADGTQTVGTWGASGDISIARSELTGYGVTHDNAVQVPAGSVYIYAGGGLESTNVDVATVSAGGDLSWASADAMSPARGGYAGVPGAGFLFAFGGQNSTPSDGNGSAEIDEGAVPDLVNWNNEGVRLLDTPGPLYFAGACVESAFVYVVGGDTAAGPTNLMQRTVL